MKLLQTIIFVFFSFIAGAQDVNFKQDIRFTLTHGGSRKWVGIDKTQTLSGPASVNLVFHANHKAEQVPVNSHKSPVSTNWQLITGTTTHDEKIELQIGDVIYTVLFSKTANGSDFMTLNYYQNERLVSRSYYCE